MRSAASLLLVALLACPVPAARAANICDPTVGTQCQAVDPNTKSARTTAFPTNVGTLGAYSWGASSGIMAAGLGAAAEIMQFRWSHATNLALIRSVRFSATVNGTAFAAGSPHFFMTVARAWSAQGTGGTGIAFGANDGKKRTSFATTGVASGDLRIATTAALGAGTKTLDGQHFAAITGVTGTATTGQIVSAGTILWRRDGNDEWPLILAQNEGFAVRATVPATGTWQFTVYVEWLELASFP